MNNKKFNLRNRIKSFGYAFNGIKLLIKGEPNAWIHCFSTVCVIIAGFFFSISSIEWICVSIVIGMVLAAEGFNSAIELMADEICKDYNEQIKKIKDIAAGAVLFTAISAFVVGCIIFIPKIISYISN